MNRQPKSTRGYDRLAPVYQFLERVLFRGKLQRARVALLDELPEWRDGLVLGDGDGRLLEQLCRSHPNTPITSIDQSNAMLRQQRSRVLNTNAAKHVTFECSDAREFHPSDRRHDLLVTAFFLDCFTPEELSVLLPQWLRGVRRGGHLYFVDFAQPESGWRKVRASIYLQVMHRFFRWQTGLPNLCLPEFSKILNAQGLALCQSRSLDHGLIDCRLYRVP